MKFDWLLLPSVDSDTSVITVPFLVATLGCVYSVKQITLAMKFSQLRYSMSCP